MIHSFLQVYLSKINELCRSHNAVRLYAFGSVTSIGFDEHKSDVDLLVELSEELSPEQKGKEYFILLFELEKLFHRRVDLIMGHSFCNPYFAHAVEQSKQLLYAA